jgi:four helix bundle protein
VPTVDAIIEDLKNRTKNFATRIIKLFAALPKTIEAQVIGKQILRSGTSVGAQYRESQFAKSEADFINKIEGSLQELEETSYWLELLDEMQLFDSQRLQLIRQETRELTAIFVTIAKKVKAKRAN